MTIYNVLINSNNRVAGGTTTSSAHYYFNWGSVLPQGEYLLRWGFTSSNVNTMVNKTALISVELGQSSVYTASSSSVRASTTNIIGTAIPNESDLSSFLYGDTNTNGVVYLSNAPSVNQFKVELYHLNGTLWTDGVGNPLSEYSLALNFEKI
jgi:hypothetical protein